MSVLPSKRVLDDLKEIIGDGEKSAIEQLRDSVASEITWYEGYGQWQRADVRDRLHAYYIVMDRIESVTGELTEGDREGRNAWREKRIPNSSNLLEVAASIKDPALWAAMMLTKEQKEYKTVGDACDAIKEVMRLAMDRAWPRRTDS